MYLQVLLLFKKYILVPDIYNTNKDTNLRYRKGIRFVEDPKFYLKKKNGSLLVGSYIKTQRKRKKERERKKRGTARVYHRKKDKNLSRILRF